MKKTALAQKFDEEIGFDETSLRDRRIITMIEKAKEEEIEKVIKIIDEEVGVGSPLSCCGIYHYERMIKIKHLLNKIIKQFKNL